MNTNCIEVRKINVARNDYNLKLVHIYYKNNIMTVEEINQEIQIINMRLSIEDKQERAVKLQNELKRLNYKKEIEVIKQKIEALDKI